MFGIFAPAAHRPVLSDEKIDPTYKKLRWQIFIGIFIGYAGYYLVRKSFSLAVPSLIAEGYSRGQLGIAMSGIALAYGLSKFFMGTVSDRSNPKYFLSAGMLGSSLVMLLFGCTEWATASVPVMFILLFLNGWFQGMGWPACGRTIVHWWSHRERGRIYSFWNVSHNVGGGLVGLLFAIGMAWFGNWRHAFYVPSMMALSASVFCFLMMQDTPQSCGLPSIEVYKNDFPAGYNAETSEVELTTKEILFQYVLKNRLLWYIALANVFIYVLRYGILDWAPLFLQEAKNFSINKSSMAYFLYEWAGIPGILICGWVSDKVFKGNRSITGILFMILTGIATFAYWMVPAGKPLVSISALILIGMLVYGPVMLIGLHALELVPKKAAGTAAGFTGMFGYIGGSIAANAILGALVDKFGWTGGFCLLFGSCVMSIILLTITTCAQAKSKKEKLKG